MAAFFGGGGGGAGAAAAAGGGGAAPPPPGDEPASRLLLHLACAGLKNMDRFSKSDPQVFVELDVSAGATGRSSSSSSSSAGDGNWVLLGKTEVVDDNLSPRFATAIPVDYCFERVQRIRLVVVDVDKGKGELRWQEQDLIGLVETTVANVVGARGGELTRPLGKAGKPGNAAKYGTITVTAEQDEGVHVDLKLRFSARHVDKKDFFGRSDPFLVVSKQHESPSGDVWLKVHQTEVVKNTLDPVWRPIEITAAKLCGGDLDRPLKFEVWDWDKNSSPDFIGSCTSSVRELEQRGELALINAKKKKKKGSKYHDSGLLRCDGVEMTPLFTFVDYMRGGCQLNLMASVDFTASNGRPNQTNSLHYVSPYQMNQYQASIASVGSILLPYDYDGMVPIYGFGARLPTNPGKTSHLFALNGNESNPEVRGVQGMLDVYQRNITTVQLYGPTNFAPTINSAMGLARTLKPGSGYLVLLILTDGVITDMDATVDALVEASSLAMSVIIVGVGSADFEAMEVLDADENVLKSSRGKTAERDIVQFVPFSDFAGAPPAALAAAVLEEIPGQVCEYFKLRKIAPVAPPPPYTP